MEENLYKTAVLTMDVEDWYHLEYFKNHKCDKNQTCIDGLDIFIDILNKHHVRGSFFLVASLIELIKNEIKNLFENGHDIGYHSWNHDRSVTLKNKDFEDDLQKGIKSLNSVTKTKSFGFRAPCFSLDSNKLNLLIKNNFKYDSSKIDQKEHPLYVNLDLNEEFVEIEKNSIYKNKSFYEFQISTVNFFGKKIPISGGGYLRIIPWFLFKYLLKKYLKNNSHYNFFIHPFELSKSKIKKPKSSSIFSKIRFEYNRKRTKKRLEKIILILKNEGYHFVTFNDMCK